ncbi:MAG: hypothetical protein Q8P18_23430 [Pseudomonadota bacterium]|nr:hypothetical protein [Pseudomonadota bacterium]
MLTWWILAWTMLGCALRGGTPHEVDLADLAALSPEGLETLRDEEHGLAVARTLLAGARAEEVRAAARVDAAQARVRQLELELEVAEASLDAARASGDASRQGLALGRQEAARRAASAAEAAEQWQIAAREATKEETRLADARVGLRTAELEMARLELLERHDQARGYMRSDFTEQLRDAQRRYDEAARRYDKAAEGATRAYERWRALERGTLG